MKAVKKRIEIEGLKMILKLNTFLHMLWNNRVN